MKLPIQLWCWVIVSAMLALGTTLGRADVLKPSLPQDISRLFDASDLVCSGVVLQVSVKGTTFQDRYGQRIRRRSLVTGLDVRRVYKGPMLQTVSIESNLEDVARDDAPDHPDSVGIKKGDYILAFLQRTGSAYSYTDNVDLRLAQSPLLSRSHGSGLQLLEADLIAGLEDRDSRSAIANLALLMTYPQLTSTAEVAELIKRGDLSIDAMVFPILLKNRDLSHSREMLDFARRIPDEGVLSFDDTPLLSALSNTRDDHATTLLADFLRVDNRYFRRSALQALREIRSEGSIPAIVKTLDDPDPFVRFLAIKTLSEITGITDPQHSPSLPEFEKSGTQFVQLWKQWWNDVGKARYVQSTDKR